MCAVLAAVQLNHSRFLGTNREKTLARNVDGSMWALNGDSVRLICNDRSTALAVWTRRWRNGTETSINHVIIANVGSVVTLIMSQSLNGSSYRCRLADRTFSVIFTSGWITFLLGGIVYHPPSLSVIAATFLLICADDIRLNCVGITPCVNVGDTLKKNCVITGLPEPNVTVSKSAGNLLSKRLPLVDLSGLTFRYLALTDRGTYRLTAKNILEEISTTISVRTGVEICCEFTVRLLKVVLNERF